MQPTDGTLAVVDFQAGKALLHTWFDDANGQPLCGAYYVTVERL